MTPEQVVRLDNWLAARVAVGERWIAGNIDDGRGGHCFLGQLMCEQCGDHTAAHAHVLRPNRWEELEAEWGIDHAMQWTLAIANNENNGSPGAVRAELHRLYPWLESQPQLTEVAHV